MLDHSKLVFIGKKPSAFRTCKDKELLSLYPNETKKEKKMLACDTEDNSKGETIMVNFFDGLNHYTFRNTEQATDWLYEVSKYYKRGVEVWFANAQYDIANVYRKSQAELSFTIAGSRFITGKVYKEKIKFKDIFNIIPGSSVKTLGKMINLSKLDHGIDFDNEEYCQRDTEIVYWAKLLYEEKLQNMGVALKNTAAGIGFTALLQTYTRLSFNNIRDEEHEFMQKGFHGGRTEVFYTKKIEGDIYGFDIVSCYPHVMRHIPIVDTFSRVFTKRPRIETREGMSDCLVRAPKDIKVPYLALKHDNKLIFPVGEFRGVWTYFELREAKKLGYEILEHYKSIEFKRELDFKLDSFVEKIFKMRKLAKENKDDVLQYACKIILNASYGRFAMGNEKTELVAFDEFHKIKGDFSSEVFPNNQIIVKRKTNYPPTTNYFYAASITAYGRHELYQHLVKATENGRTLLYCDTDSIFFHGSSDYFTSLSDFNSGRLGSLTKEYEISEAHFILPKTYFVKLKNGREIYKCKGVRGELAKEFFTKGYAESMQPLKYVETCRKNFFIKERNKKFGTKEPYIPFNVWVKKPKSLKSKYDKRISDKSGHTKPINLNYDVDKGLNY